MPGFNGKQARSITRTPPKYKHYGMPGPENAGSVIALSDFPQNRFQSSSGAPGTKPAITIACSAATHPWIATKLALFRKA
jgi:hypothetical protein